MWSHTNLRGAPRSNSVWWTNHFPIKSSLQFTSLYLTLKWCNNIIWYSFTAVNLKHGVIEQKMGLYTEDFCASDKLKFNAVLIESYQNSGMNWKFVVPKCTDHNETWRGQPFFCFSQRLHLKGIKNGCFLRHFVTWGSRRNFVPTFTRSDGKWVHQKIEFDIRAPL